LHTAESSTPPIKIIDEWRSWALRFKTVSQQNRAVARLIAPIPMSMAEILRGVQKSHATILDYFMGDESSIIFTINGAGRITATVIPVGRKRVDAQVAAFYAALPKTEGANPQALLNEKRILQALYTEIFPASIRSFLPADAEHMLIVIPDGSLFNLPFGALISEQQKYLVENHMICIAPSVATIVDMPPRYTDEMNGVFAAQQPQGDEASALTSAFTPGAVLKLVGKDALDAHSVIDQSRGKAVLQLADRFTFSNAEPMAAEGAADAKKLTPDKLLGQSIPNDLLVFSGSAVNPKDSQGISLRLSSRGLSYEGTRNVLIGMWQQASDDRTTELSEFYKNLQLGLNQADSLRKAQLMSLSKDNAPHSWAAMQLLGAGY
jgi:CHAT domain-containing protein